MKKNLFCYLVLILISFSYFLFFENNTYLVGDDTIFHTSNILVMAGDINWFNLIPGKIMPTLVNNLGYGINIFYPMFPHLIGAYIYNVFSLFGIGIAGVMKFIHFMIIFLSGVFMYKYIMVAFKNRKQALLTAALYQSTPYMFTDVFMRGAFNESFIFIYLPIIFLGLYYLFETDEKYKFYFYFILGYSLLIFTHLVLAVYLTLILIPFILIYYKKIFNIKYLKDLVLGSIIILLITSNFWIPLMEHYWKDIYYIFKIDYVKSFSVEVPKILYYLFPIRFADVRENYFLLFYISPLCLILMACNYFRLFKNKRKVNNTKKLLFGMVLVLIFSIILASISFIWKFMPNLLRNIQFAWRLSLFIAFSSVIIGGYGITLFKDKMQKIIIVVVILLSTGFNIYLSSNLVYRDINKIDFLKNSCCDLQWSYEYIPMTSKVNSLHLYNKNEFLGIHANNFVKVLKNNVPNMKFSVNNIKDELIVEFPRIYYLGYELKDDNDNVIDLYQNSFGLLEAVIDKEGIYYLEYKGTILDRVTKVIAIITICSFILYFVFKKVYKKKY